MWGLSCCSEFPLAPAWSGTRDDVYSFRKAATEMPCLCLFVDLFVLGPQLCPRIQTAHKAGKLAGKSARSDQSWRNKKEKGTER